MNECTYKSFDELPLMLNVVQVAAVLGISRAGAYELVHSEGLSITSLDFHKDLYKSWLSLYDLQSLSRP